MINNLNNPTYYTNTDVEGPKLLNIKLINEKCGLLLKQIEELKYNYQEMLMNRNKKDYTFIEGKKLVHIQPYNTKDVKDVNVCKAMCSNRKDCWGFNSYDNMSLFNKYPTTCDFISQGDITNTGSITQDGRGASVHIKIDDENLKTTKRVLDRLISEFHAACNRNMDLIERFETNTKPRSIIEGLVPEKFVVSSGKNEKLNTLRTDLLNHKNSLEKILNDANFIEKDYDNTYLHTTHNNIMLSLFTIVIIILIMIIFKTNITGY
jgi:DNA-binding protein YbaB